MISNSRFYDDRLIGRHPTIICVVTTGGSGGSGGYGGLVGMGVWWGCVVGDGDEECTSFMDILFRERVR